MKLKPISKAILAAAAAASIMPFAAQAADVNVYGLVATGLYYQKTEGADNGNVGMAQYKQTPTDSHFGITGREDLGNGLYVGFQLENGYSTDSGAMWENDRLFNRVARLYAGNSQIEVSMGRISTFTCASDPYSVFRKLRANMTASGLPGMAPATMVFNVGEMDNAIAFRTNGDDGFFVQGFYSNGSSSEETKYGWSNNNHVIQAAFGWTGQSLRIGTVLNWERPSSHTDGTKPRKNETTGIHILGSYDFGGPAVSAIFYKGSNDWRIGGAPDMADMIKGVGGSTNYADSEDSMDLTVGFVSVGYPMGAHFFSAGLGVINADWKGISTNMKETKGTAYQASLMYYYNLSKRTQLYSGVSYSDGDKLLDTVDRFNQIFGTVGLQHRF